MNSGNRKHVHRRVRIAIIVIMALNALSSHVMFMEIYFVYTSPQDYAPFIGNEQWGWYYRTKEIYVATSLAIGLWTGAGALLSLQYILKNKYLKLAACNFGITLLYIFYSNFFDL